MGRRRPWVLGAQLGMTLSFFSLTLIDNPTDARARYYLALAKAQDIANEVMEAAGYR